MAVNSQARECERCGAGPAGAGLFKRCALCGIRLCDDCAATGCCGVTPAMTEGDEDKNEDKKD